MTRELIFSGFIPYNGLTAQELKFQIQQEIFSKLTSSMEDRIEIHFGVALYNRLRDEGIINYPLRTIGEINCVPSYTIENFAYYVYLKHDHEDRMDAMTAWFNPDVKKNLNVAFGKSSVHIDISGRIKKIIFNPPATIIFWKDGSKTVVKCNGEAFDPEKGMAMAISRKVLGDSYDYYNVFEKWCKKYKEPKSTPTPQEVAAKYMTPPTIPESAAEEVKRYTKIESGDSEDSDKSQTTMDDELRMALEQVWKYRHIIESGDSDAD